MLLVLVFLTATCITIIQPAKAEVENVGTSCSIFVDNIVEGQPINVVVQIYPAPPSTNDVFENLTVILFSPAQGISGYGPWQKGPSSSDSNGIASFTFNVPAFSGTWQITLIFKGQYFANNTIYYQQGDWQKKVHISSAQTPTPSPTVSPSPSPTPSTTLSPSPSPKENNTTGNGDNFPTTTLALIIVIAILAISAVSILLYRRQRD